MPPWTAKTPPASAFETGESVSVLPGQSFTRPGFEQFSLVWRPFLSHPLLCLSLKMHHLPMMSSPCSEAWYSQIVLSNEFLPKAKLNDTFISDLRNLRSQLYSAAEYFELSYINDVQKQISVDSLKDYTVKALVNTVDHLGSVSCKVNGFLDEKVDEVSGTEFRVSSIEQRVRTCQEFIDHEGISQQSLVISTPRYHKRYTLPVDQSLPVSGRHAIAQCQEIDLPREDRELQLFQPVRLTIRDRPPPVRKFHSPSPLRRARSSSPSRKFHSPSPSPRPGNLQSSEGRAGSPIPASNPSPLYRYASFSRASTFLNSSNNVQRFPDEPRKSTSVLLHAEREDQKEADQNPGKSKRLLRALLSRRKSRRDDMLYMYLDEY